MILKLIKNFLKKFRIFYIIKDKIQIPNSEKKITSILPGCNCIDVGASYFEHSKWRVFLKSINTEWIAVDPNAKNLNYLQNWRWKSKLKAIDKGLSEDGGEKILYVTNTDSGSSIKKPLIADSHKIRKINLDYFFPYQEKKILTTTLFDIVKSLNNTKPLFIKLDTQGSELDILKSAKIFFENFRILGVELETSILAQPCYEGANKLAEVLNFFEEKKYELININIFDLYTSQNNTQTKNFFPNETDVVFAPRLEEIKKMPFDYKLNLIGFFYSYKLYNHILYLVEDNKDLYDFFNDKKINLKEIL